MTPIVTATTTTITKQTYPAVETPLSAGHSHTQMCRERGGLAQITVNKISTPTTALLRFSN